MYSNKTYRCPFFKWDERLCVHCELGTRIKFPDIKVRGRYVDLFCANNPGWEKCSVADSLNKYYEENENGKEKENQ